MSNNKKVAASSGNVFADLGFANPEEELLKAKMVRELRGIIKRRKLTQGCRRAWAEAAGCFCACHRPRRQIFDRSIGSMPGPVGLQGGPRRALKAAPRFFAGNRGVGPQPATAMSITPA